MSENKTNNRRKVLLGLGGGIAGATQLPKSWSKPVMDSILLPAHAQTTVISTFSGPASEVVSNRPTRHDILSDLISPAVALIGSHISADDLYIAEVANGGFEAFVLLSPMHHYGRELDGPIEEVMPVFKFEGVYKAVGQINGPSADLTLFEGCDVHPQMPKIEVTQVGEVASYIIRDAGEKIAEGDLASGNDIPTTGCDIF